MGKCCCSLPVAADSGGRQQLGDHFVEFRDGSVIVYNLGEVWARGIMYGDRVCEYLGTMEFRDEKNNL